jgi:site-specific recombinase XerD
MTEHRIALPDYAKTYLAEHGDHHAERMVLLFHKWMQRTGLALEVVTSTDVDAFLTAPAGKPIGQMTRNNYRHLLRRYLTWLEERGLAGPFDQQELQGYHRKPLPEEVRRFLQYLAPIRRRGTINIYRYTLRTFHEWLAERQGTLQSVDRDTCLAWGQHLHAQGLHPATRVGQLVCLRKYLDWLWEHGLVAQPGHVLVQASDLPKKPEYLPRPLPPDADQKLQEQLREAESPVALGLYVMRRTGIRIGELRTLERDCVRADPSGRPFLKVPLGKLHNERLVPLDPATLAAVTELQSRAAEGADWLIEGSRHRPVAAATYQAMLIEAATAVGLAKRPTTHQLRHSFATSLMNGGMSLMGVMKLLGHRDYRMTLRYTAIADETVNREYFEALGRLAARYELFQPESACEPAAFDPVVALADVIRWVESTVRAKAEQERDGKLLHQAILVIRGPEKADRS